MFKINNRDEYHVLYVQSETLLSADVFENFRNMSLDIYGLDPTYYVSAPGWVWQACLKNAEVKLELLTDYDMILMIENGIRGGICQATHRYAKANNKYMKNYDKNIESSYIEYLDANNWYGRAMFQKRPTNGFIWVEDLSQFNENFIKKNMMKSYVGYFLEVDIDYSKRLSNLHTYLPFLTEMYEFWYDYISPKYGNRAKPCYTDTDSFVINIKTEYFFEDISNDVEGWLDASNYDKNHKRLLPIGENKKVSGIFKDKLGGKIMIEVVVLRPKAYAYLDDDRSEHKKLKVQKIVS